MLWWLLRRKHILVLAIIFFASIGIRAQCTVPAGFVCITQETADKLAKALDESKAKDALIAAYKNVEGLTLAERNAFQAALKATQEVIDAKDKAIIDRDKVIALYQKTVDALMTLNERLTNALNRPKSGWQKFLAVLEKILYLVAGVSLGRGL